MARSATQFITEARAAGRDLDPVETTARGKIAHTFWGAAWCTHFEEASDYANRLPRGRSYVRHGAVVDLQIDAGRVDALVCGSRPDPYRVTFTVAALTDARWQSIVARCAPSIDAVVDVLSGRLSDDVIAVLCDADEGMLPRASEIGVTCSCPDWARMCKHAAAALYGVGVRLDRSPELLFRLRGVDEHALAAQAFTAIEPAAPDEATLTADEHELSALFGIAFDDAEPASSNGAEPLPEPTPQTALASEPTTLFGRAVESRLSDGARTFLRTALPDARVTAWQARVRAGETRPTIDPVELLGDCFDLLAFTTPSGDAWMGFALPIDRVDYGLLEAAVDGRMWVWHELEARDVLVWQVSSAQVVGREDAAIDALRTARRALLAGDASILRAGFRHAWHRALEADPTALTEDGALDDVTEPDFGRPTRSDAADVFAHALGLPQPIWRAPAQRGQRLRDVLGTSTRDRPPRSTTRRRSPRSS